jgi:predicted small metal-binding protein
MSVSTTCKGCGLEFVGKDEEDLVTQVQAHIAEAHAHGHAPSRDQVREVIRKRWERTAEGHD